MRLETEGASIQGFKDVIDRWMWKYKKAYCTETKYMM